MKAPFSTERHFSALLWEKDDHPEWSLTSFLMYISGTSTQGHHGKIRHRKKTQAHYAHNAFHYMIAFKLFHTQREHLSSECEILLFQEKMAHGWQQFKTSKAREKEEIHAWLLQFVMLVKIMEMRKKHFFFCVCVCRCQVLSIHLWLWCKNTPLWTVYVCH